MTLIAYPQRVLRPAPESIPRQKAYTYMFLICFTGLLIYFYSYPLNMEDWSYIKIMKAPDTESTHFVRTSESGVYEYNFDTEDFSSRSESLLLQKLFANLSSFVSKKIPLRTDKIISNKTALPLTKSGDLSMPFNTSSRNEFENAEAQSTGTSTDAVVTNEARSDYAKNVTQMVDIKAGENEYFLTTSIKTETSKNMTEKLPSTNYDYEDSASNTRVTESEHLLTTTVKIRTNKDMNKNLIPTSDDYENTSGKSTNLPTIKQHENKITTLFNTVNTETYEKQSSSILNRTIRSRVITNKPNVQDMTPKTLITVERTSHTALKDNFATEAEKSIPPTVNVTSMSSPSIQEGFLVFSQHCRIPDLDPMHPSIRHLIEKNPPLDCSENHKPLTKTEGHVLILDEGAVLKVTGGHNYTCCYKSVFRIKDGLSDNGVGYGEECIKISTKTAIEDEFITVECKHHNGTLFYKEFHSFIFDKPKVEKRCNKTTKPQYSVLIIGVDAVSRMNMHRQLNATADYMLREMGAIEMYGFNKVGDNTFPNLIPLMTGYDERELPSVCWKSSHLPLDRCNFLWKRFAEKGYRTLYAEDSPHISSFNYLKDGFFHQPTDYYFRHFILAYEDALGRDKPLNCYLCVGSKSQTEAVLHWTEEFASHFSERPYFSFSWINSLTHDFLNMGSSGDQMYERFFRNLHRSGALDKTIIVLMGDHGMRWGAIRNTYIGRLEERLPMLLIALPDEFKRQYPKFATVLKENSHRLVTPFDLHATLVHLLNLTDSWKLENTDKVDDQLSKNFTRRALSLFQPVPDNRSCDDAFIEEHWCTCESSLEADIESDGVKRVAKFLLNSVNNLLKPTSNKCAVLTLDSVSDARLWQPPSEHKGHSFDDNIYTVVIRTNPGKAVFEGTVKVSQPMSETTLLGTISRLNLYGNQSSCIDNAVLRKYCYCL